MSNSDNVPGWDGGVGDHTSGSAGSATSSGSYERGAELLDDIETFLSRFIVYPNEDARVAHVLWIAHTWFMDQWESTPRIAFLSPEPGSGKSRALEVTEPLVPRPVHAVNASPSALFRTVADPEGLPTILFDEIDTIFGPRAKENEDLRGLINAGHRKGAITLRSIVKGKAVEVERFESYCAVALAGLNDLPDTIMSRSVVVRMQRRAPGETVEPWRLRVQRQPADALAERLMEWSNLNQHTISTWPDMPDEIQDRNADVWESLIAVADLAGGHWPERARVTGVTLVTDFGEAKTSIGVMLLRDVRDIFTKENVDRILTTDLLEQLNNMDESPWGDIRGKPLDSRGLSRRLGKYQDGEGNAIKPTTVRVGDHVAKGYRVEDLRDAWTRYLQVTIPPGGVGSSSGDESKSSRSEAVPLSPRGSVTSVTTVTDSEAANEFEGPQTCIQCGAEMLYVGYSRDRCEACRIANVRKSS